MSHMYPSGASVGFEDQSHIGEPNEPGQCEHQPDGMEINSDNEIISTCEHCGRSLQAAAIDQDAVIMRGELYITEWREA